MPLMFAVGLALEGRLFPFAAVAARRARGDRRRRHRRPYLAGKALSLGAGTVTAVTYEYPATPF
jgi:hypothetical protein